MKTRKVVIGCAKSFLIHPSEKFTLLVCTTESCLVWVKKVRIINALQRSLIKTSASFVVFCFRFYATRIFFFLMSGFFSLRLILHRECKCFILLYLLQILQLKN